MMDAATGWLFLIILPIAGIGGGLWGLFTITPMTTGWLACGLAFGLVLGMLAHIAPVMTMDSGPDWVPMVAVPVAVCAYGFAVFCVGVFIWRGTGIRIDVAVH